MSNNNAAVHPLTHLFENVTTTQYPYRRVVKGHAVRSRPVLIDGVEYPSISSAVRNLKLCANVMGKRLDSSEFPNYQYIKKTQ